MGRLATRRYVELGRIVKLNYGRHAGKVAAVVSLGDHNRCIVHGPGAAQDVPRHEVRLRNVTLTGIVVPKDQVASPEAFQHAVEQWQRSPTVRHAAAKQAKSAATDFERFKGLVRIAKQRKQWLPKYAEKRQAVLKAASAGLDAAADLRRKFA
eukprot:TRINITY_DN275_c0_g1_i1.p3 TRINITY_DN275_c0_g1~~TRINITY_DN275_c0_g1_i1.p3  ORF type:complete len:153 (-),score=32.44 TRINITY_DN275_c0_g1_i1:84-542(-)